MRRFVLAALGGLLVVFLVRPGFAEQTRFSAQLSGRSEVPALKTAAKGDFKLTVFEDGLSFELNVSGLLNPLTAYIHKGRRGENGPPVAGLFGGPPKRGTFSGVLAEGTITGESLLGELQGKGVAELLRLIRSGEAYVNVTTGTFPDGEIRGQIQ